MTVISKISPYTSLFKDKVERWNGYVDMKFYFDKRDSTYDADNYFFLRAEVDESELGSDLQRLFDPSRDEMEKRTSLTAGLGWEF